MRRIASILGVSAAAVMLTATTAFAGSVGHSRVASTNPVDNTVQVPPASGQEPDNATEVSDLAQGAGNSILAVGRIPSVVERPTNTRKSCGHFFETTVRTSGTNTASCWARFNGITEAVVTTTDRKFAYVAGSFTSVTAGSTVSTRVAKLDLVNRRVVGSFRVSASGQVNDLQLVGSHTLLVGGTISSPRKALFSVNTTTGALTNYANLNLSGNVDPNVTSPTKVYRIAVSPVGGKAVIIGNFTSVGGQRRHNAAMLNLGTTATVSPWYSQRLESDCGWQWFGAYLRGVDFSPNGQFFNMTATGGETAFPKLCDTVSQWRVDNSTNAVPMWVNYTNRDTMHGVINTGAAVYIGGHQKQLNFWVYRNDVLVHSGKVDRFGIGALDPVTGMALSWNPTRDRGKGARAFVATSNLLCVGSDTAYNSVKLGGENHAGFGCFPV